MDIIRARSAGFCLGVSLALRALDREINATPVDILRGGRIITLGPIIHNPLVMREYEAKGVMCLDDPTRIRPEDRVIVRAHGIPIDMEETLVRLGVTLIDATCPKVKKAQLLITRHRRNFGGTLLLFGEAEHPEVRGLVSYAEGDALVFGNLEELEALPLKAENSYFLAAQTTQDSTVFMTARDALSARLHCEIPLLDTICDATRQRQDEVVTLARHVEAIVVVGGRNSGNTRRLAEVARAQGVIAVHVEEAADLQPEMLAGAHTVGLTAGASTPEAHIDAMHRLLESL